MNKDILTADLCQTLASAARQESERIGVGVTVSITDENGNLRLLQRFGDAILPSIDISQNKAYTAATVHMSTEEFGRIAQPGASAYGINVTHPRLVIFGGGFPLHSDGRVVGAIGVSGGSVAEDEQVAKKVLEAYNNNTLLSLIHI